MQSRLFIITILIVLVFNVFVSSQNASDDNSINNSDVLIENANEKKTTSKEIPQTNNFKTTIRKTYSTSSISESKTTTTVNSSNTSSAVADSSRNHESINSAVSSSPNNENGNTAIPVNQAVADPNQYVVDTNESDEFERFLNEINFKIVKPKNNSTIYSNSSINVEWECDEVPADKKYNISVYLQNLVNIYFFFFYYIYILIKYIEITFIYINILFYYLFIHYLYIIIE